MGSSAEVGLQAFWGAGGREEAAPCALLRAGARGCPARQQLVALLMTWERGACGEAQTGLQWRALACVHSPHTRHECVCVCVYPRACSSVSLQADPGFRGGQHAESALSVTTWAVCDPVECSPPVLSVPGILQTRTLEWVAILQGVFPHPEIEPRFSHNAGRFFTF